MKFLFLLLSAAIVFAQQPAAPAAAADPVVITVGTEKITKSQFEEILSTFPDQQRAQLETPAGRKQLAERLVELKTLAQEGRRRKLDQTPKVQTQMKLQADQLMANLVYQDLGTAVKVDEATERTYYTAHKDEYEQVKARHILIRFQGSPVPVRTGQKDLTDAEALTKVQEIRAKLNAANFAELAKAESDDVGTAQNGGDLGGFARGNMVPEFDKAAFDLEAGKISDPVKTQFGYHLILVESHANKTFEEVKPEIDQKVKPEMMQKGAQQGLDDLKKKTTIVIDENFFK